MNTGAYLAALDRKLRELAGIIVSSSIQREVDANLSVGLTKGRIAFIDGSFLEFSEQFPTERRKFRFQYMDAHLNRIVRWDSAPHHEGLSTFLFHKHSMQDVEAHPAITLLEALDEITRNLKA